MVRVQKQLEGEHTFLSVMRPGETVGEQAVLNPDARDSTAETLAQCTLWEIRRADFIDAAGIAPSLWPWLTARLQSRLAHVEQRLHHVTHDRVPDRIMALVGGLSSADPNFKLPLTQWDVALLVGATRETTSTALNQLELQGKVKLGRGFIQFLNFS